MNKSFRLMGLVMAALIFSAIAAEAQSRIATVELTKLFDNYWKTKRAKLALADRKADLKKDLDGMQESHKKLVQEFQKLQVEAYDQAVSSEERDKRKKQLEIKAKEVKESEDTVKQFVGRGDAELEQLMRRMMDEVLKEINDVVAAKGKAGGYAYVFDSSADSMSRARVMLYNNGEADITASVLDQLNAAAPPEPVATPEKKK